MTWIHEFKNNLLEVLYRDDQPRDELGRFAEVGSAGADESSADDRIASFIEPDLTGDEYHLALTKETLSKLTDEQKASVARGMEDVLGPTGTKIQSLTTFDPDDPFSGVSQGTLAYYDPGTNQISFNENLLGDSDLEEFLDNTATRYAEDRIDRIASLSDQQDLYRDILDTGPDIDGDYVNPATGEVLDRSEVEENIAFTEGALQHIPPRYSAVEVAEDPWYALTVHEAFHAVYFGDNNSQPEWARQRGLQGLRASDFAQVSAYAMSDFSESFSEVGVAINTGLEVPDNVRVAFENVMSIFD